MGGIGELFPTLSQITKKLDPDGSVANVVEALEKVNPLLQDIAFKEGNLPTGHRVTSRSALPTPTWRRFNEGVDSSVSSTEQFDEVCGMLEDFSKIDVDMAELNGNGAVYRADEDKAFVQGFNQEVNRALFYESLLDNPGRIHGLTPRFDYTSGNPASGQIIKADSNASGSDQASIWLIGWSPDTVFGIFPKGSKAGLSYTDLGKQLVNDRASKQFLAWVTDWKWKLGLCVRDYRYVVRVCNIDMSAAIPAATGGADIPMAMEDAVAALHEMMSCQPVFYMCRQVFSLFNKQLMKGSANLLEWVDRGGQRVPHFLGVPIRVADALTITEDVVS